MATLISPLSVAISRNKNWILNLNNYRNTHYQSLNKSKIEYKKFMYPQIQSLPQYSRAFIIYTLYPKTNRKCDVANICAIHDKYFCDALSELGKIPDDNYDHLPLVLYLFGGVDKDNPRVEIQIKELNHMQIKKTLDVVVTQADVEKAIIEMIQSKDPSVVVDAITFTCKRGGDETLNIKVEAHDGSAEAPAEAVARTDEVEAPKATKRAPKKVKTPEPETVEVEEALPEVEETTKEEAAAEEAVASKGKSLFS